MSDTQTQLGKLIGAADLQRDAVHIAVAPVVAAIKLYPGDDIGFATDDLDMVSSSAANPIGIVDPFLKKPVMAGERFWMFLYPNTITSLKHIWTHPGFEMAPKVRPNATSSEVWLRNFIAQSNCPDYESVINAAVGDHEKNERAGDDYFGSCRDGDSLRFVGRDASGDIPDEFWRHVEIVTGRKIEERPSYFSCSC